MSLLRPSSENVLPVCGVQVGSFKFEKRQYSLVTPDVDKALNFDNKFKMRSLGMHGQRLNVNISNSAHIIEPETNDELETDFDPGNCRQVILRF